MDTWSYIVCQQDSLSIWQILFTISVTINLIILVSTLLSWFIKIICRWRSNRFVITKRSNPVSVYKLDDFIHKERLHIAQLITDALVNYSLVVGGVYLLINGAVADPFIVKHHSYCSVFNIATILSAISIGRLSVVVAMEFRRVRLIDHPDVVASLMRQVLEQMFCLIASFLILTTHETLLTKALLLIMCVDQNVTCLSALVHRYPKTETRRLTIIINVAHCFLTIAFRIAVPLVCLVVSVALYDKDIGAMSTRSMSIFLACAVVYGMYNPYIMVSVIRSMWKAFQITNIKKSDNFFTNHPNNRTNLEFGLPTNIEKRNLHIVNELYLDSDKPPCYCKVQKDARTFCLMCNRNTPVPSQQNNLIVDKNQPKHEVSSNTHKQPQQTKENNKAVKLHLPTVLPTIAEETNSMVDIPLN